MDCLLKASKQSADISHEYIELIFLFLQVTGNESWKTRTKGQVLRLKESMKDVFSIIHLNALAVIIFS